jgi:broad specificity phosphatase PhoE
MVSEHDRDRPIEVQGDARVPVGPGHTTSFDARTLDFGHHAGRSIEELAEIDPDYLRWLARHPSGFRYRAEIGRVLESAVPRAVDWRR